MMNFSAEVIGITGIVIVLVGAVAAIILDIKIHKKNLILNFKLHKKNLSSIGTIKVYRPNLRIWGIGVLTGAVIFIIPLFCYAIQKLIVTPPTSNTLWLSLAPLCFLTVVIGLLTWGLVALCWPE
jgi:uncharacterized membrane protein YgdD (TMEM256/DUF423 family)